MGHLETSSRAPVSKQLRGARDGVLRSGNPVGPNPNRTPLRSPWAFGNNSLRLFNKAYLIAPTTGCVHAVSNSSATLPFTLAFEEITRART